jgi:hypothetical protein
MWPPPGVEPEKRRTVTIWTRARLMRAGGTRLSASSSHLQVAPQTTPPARRARAGSAVPRALGFTLYTSTWLWTFRVELRIQTL